MDLSLSREEKKLLQQVLKRILSYHLIDGVKKTNVKNTNKNLYHISEMSGFKDNKLSIISNELTNISIVTLMRFIDSIYREAKEKNSEVTYLDILEEIFNPRAFEVAQIISLTADYLRVHEKPSEDQDLETLFEIESVKNYFSSDGSLKKDLEAQKETLRDRLPKNDLSMKVILKIREHVDRRKEV